MKHYTKITSGEAMTEFLVEAVQIGAYDLARKHLEEVKDTYKDYQMWDTLLQVNDKFREEFPGHCKIKMYIENPQQRKKRTGMFKDKIWDEVEE